MQSMLYLSGIFIFIVRGGISFKSSSLLKELCRVAEKVHDPETPQLLI